MLYPPECHIYIAQPQSMSCCCWSDEYEDLKAAGRARDAASEQQSAPPGPESMHHHHHHHHEEDLEAIRSWRQQRGTSTTPLSPDESTTDANAPLTTQLETMPSSSAASTQERVELAPGAARAWQGQQFGEPPEGEPQVPHPPEELLTEQPDAESGASTGRDRRGLSKEQELADAEFHDLGGFPTFTKEEDEWRQRQLQQKLQHTQDAAYLSSSSSSSSTSTVEDPIFRRSPLVDGDEVLIGPVGVDETAISRPGTDDGESQPERSGGPPRPFVKVSDESFRAATAAAAAKDPPLFFLPGSPSLSHEEERLNSSAESKELDAIVAAIDETMQQTSAIIARGGLSPSGEALSQRSAAASQPRTSATASPATPNSGKKLLHPSRRDSPSVHDPSAYHAGGETVRSSSPALITASSCESSESGDGGRSLHTPEQRRRDRSRNRSRMPSPLAGKSAAHPSATAVRSLSSSPHPVPTPAASFVFADPTPEPSRDSNDDDDDRLSDVPSDVADDVKERYLKACRILKSSLIEKDSALEPSEKAFLASLLVDKAPSVGPVPTEERITDIESAAQTLQSNPLFDSTPPDSTSEASSAVPTKSERLARSLATASPAMLDIPEKITPGHNKGRQSGDQQDERDPQTKSTMSQSSSSLYSRGDDGHPFKILGIEDGFTPTVITPTLMEALRGFFPYAVAEENFLLKYALERDGAALLALLSNVRSCKHTIISVETVDGHVFGAFCSSPWRVQTAWYGSGEAFLWRLKKPRLKQRGASYDNDGDNEIEIYPYTGADEMVQYCTNQTIAVGGGADWTRTSEGSPYRGEPSGIGFLIDGDLLGGETSSCVTFANPRLGDRTAQSIEFDIHALEVWTVTPCLAVKEAEEMEVRRMFLDKHMSGR